MVYQDEDGKRVTSQLAPILIREQQLSAIPATVTGGRSRSLILTAMIFAVAMTFIDQTIVSIAAPIIQRDLGLSSSGMQWAINAYLLTLAAFFAFGGRLADTRGHRKMVVLG
jgi:Major Facilitator Superfamily